MLPSPSASAFAAASENVSPRNAVDGIPTCQPNQIFSSCAPRRMVPRLDPGGRTDADPEGGLFCPPPPPRPPVCAAAIDAIVSSKTNQRSFIEIPQTRNV